MELELLPPPQAVSAKAEADSNANNVLFVSIIIPRLINCGSAAKVVGDFMFHDSGELPLYRGSVCECELLITVCDRDVNNAYNS